MQLSQSSSGQGGCLFGFAHSDYTAAEIEEYLEATASIDRGDKIQNERANRLIRQIGVINPVTDGGSEDAAYNGGKPFRVNLNWAIPIDFQVNFWGYNISEADWTASPILQFIGEAVVEYQ